MSCENVWPGGVIRIDIRTTKLYTKFQLWVDKLFIKRVPDETPSQAESVPDRNNPIFGFPDLFWLHHDKPYFTINEYMNSSLSIVLFRGPEYSEQSRLKVCSLIPWVLASTGQITDYISWPHSCITEYEFQRPGAGSIWIRCITTICIPITKMKRSRGRHIFIMIKMRRTRDRPILIWYPCFLAHGRVLLVVKY